MAEIQTSPHMPMIAASSASLQCRAGVSCLESSSFTSDENDIGLALPSSSCHESSPDVAMLDPQSVLLMPLQIGIELLG